MKVAGLTVKPKRKWAFMLVDKITGIPRSRHLSMGGAGKTWKAKNTDRNPLEVRKYSKMYWDEMAL